MTNLLACDGAISFDPLACSTGFYSLTSVAGGSIDYTLAGQYFIAAFTVSAMIILSSVVLRTLLNFIRR